MTFTKVVFHNGVGFLEVGECSFEVSLINLNVSEPVQAISESTSRQYLEKHTKTVDELETLQVSPISHAVENEFFRFFELALV